MKIIKALIIKFAATLAASWISFSLIDINSFNWILIVAAASTVLYYTFGDLMFLSSVGNGAASIGDGIIGAVTAYVIDFLTVNFMASSNGLIAFAIIIMVAEYYFHVYLLNDEKEEHNEFYKEPPLE